MDDALYRIVDEPRPSLRNSIAVNPVWPLVTMMFAGSFIGWPWAVANSFLIGSATRVREALLAVAGFLGLVLLVAALLLLDSRAKLSNEQAAYLLVLPTLWKLGISYALYGKQARSFELYRYYGGAVKNPFLLFAVCSFWLSPRLTEHLGVFWRLVLR